MPKIGYCKDCKWWETYYDGGITELYGCGSCYGFDHPEYMEERDLTALAVYSNGVGHLWTWPDFGCLRYEGK